ncbi:hypothetical protein F383_14171 [Gossypium arboreum]|nr:hypothetical protein F383_38054 [Gossypium arboreum]KHG29356.1 hypothetical protein F383_14171 [Gossypium arboreum]
MDLARTSNPIRV